jgi:hypothetical protein
VSSAADKVFDAALNLPAEERRQLTEALVAALPAEAAADLDEAWLEAVRRRAAPFQQGETEPPDPEDSWRALEARIRAIHRK